MHALEIFVSFQKPKTLKAKLEDPLSAFGHVEAFGYTRDKTWFFLNPDRHGLHLNITHHHDEIEQMITDIEIKSDLVMAISNPKPFKLWVPLPFTCVTVIAHMCGIRAFTPWGLKRKLTAMNAEITYEKPKADTGTKG